MSWLSGWKYRRKITITEQSGNDLTDYQVLIELNESNFDFSKAKSDGSDIRFTDANGNLLPYWIEEWDSVNKKAKVWVKVPSISANEIVEIYMYYGNPDAKSQSSAEETFDFGIDFKHVFIRDENNPIITNDASWKNLSVHDPNVVRDPDTGEYHVFYIGRNTSYNRQVGHAKMTNITDIPTDDPNNPILPSGGSTYDKEIHHFAVLKDLNGNAIKVNGYYWAFYCGKGDDGKYRILVAKNTSLDGNWTPDYDNSPVLEPTEAWESYGVGLMGLEVFLDDDGKYKMLYTAYDGSHTQIGLAESTDLINWTKNPNNPVLPVVPDSWEQYEVDYPTLVGKYNGKYILIYCGRAVADDYAKEERMGLATSTDLVNWDRYGLNPIDEPRGGWEAKAISDFSAIKVGDKVYVFYEGEDGEHMIGRTWINFNSLLKAHLNIRKITEGFVDVQIGKIILDENDKVFYNIIKVVDSSKAIRVIVEPTVESSRTDVLLYASDESATIVYSSLRDTGYFEWYDGSWHNTGVAWSPNTKYTMEYILNFATSTYDWYVDDTLIATCNFEESGSNIEILRTDAVYGAISNVYAMIVRKYVDPEPSVSIGAEEIGEETGVVVTNEDAYHGSYSCKFTVVAYETEGEKYIGIKQSQDLTGWNKIKFALKITELTGSCAFEVWCDDTKLTEYTTTQDWNEKEVDVSTIDGTHEIKFIARAKDVAEYRKMIAYLDYVRKVS